MWTFFFSHFHILYKFLNNFSISSSLTWPSVQESQYVCCQCCGNNHTRGSIDIPPCFQEDLWCQQYIFFLLFQPFPQTGECSPEFLARLSTSISKSMRTGQYTDTKYFFQRFLHSLVQTNFLWKHFQTTVYYILFYLFQKFLFT